MDLNQPWEVSKSPSLVFPAGQGFYVGGVYVGTIFDSDVAERIILLARADEAQRRRGWHAVPSEMCSGISGKWCVMGNGAPGILAYHPTPAEALVAADEWLTKHEASDRPQLAVHYAPYGKNAAGEFNCGARDGGYTGTPDRVTCEACKALSPGLWPPAPPNP